MVIGAGACSQTVPSLPADPPPLARYSEYPFGTETRVREVDQQTRILAALKPRFPDVRLLPRMIPAGGDWTALGAAYQRALPGWKKLPIGGDDPDGWRFAFTDGSHVVTVAGLRRAADRATPVTIYTDLPS